MERADIKRVLKELGVANALTEMPAIVEPIYQEMAEREESDLRKEGKVVVDEDGNFIYGDKKIFLREDKCAEITFGDAQIITNAVGIEMEYQDGGNQDLFSHNKRDGGKVVNTSGNNATYQETTNLDNGSWAVRKASGIILESDSSLSGSEKKEIEESLETILSNFDAMSKSIIENYPKTARWYKTKRAEVKAIAQSNINPTEQSQKRIATLEAQVKTLEKRNGELTKTLSETRNRLGKAIDFIGVVRKSPFGKVFFGKKIKSFEEDAQSLPEGKDNK